MESARQLLDIFIHLDVHLKYITETYGALTYGILFLIIFCETGLVVTPFLPGDSLIFAAGALAGLGALDIFKLIPLLFFATFLGDNVNYHLGKFIGAKIVAKENLKLIKKEHIEKTQGFYDKYGGATVIIARFVPIVRTFAPFVAGIGKMKYIKFLSFSIVGSLLWVSLCSCTGFFFGNIPVVKNNFSLVCLAIIGISIMPAVITILKQKRASKVN
ncbi:membrane-associated protein [Clostridium cavendishii DSM 21758]|uniref:Membrane-associated protein n=1 Tax=Clostridium cavendishii DSM 21758 TaxID=1121302 RepID=A0A1M6JFP8_9CLOT|nr:DedA family protein [Clostridium cavendishii]SHJ45527.1 membrane-associated protein [Clostridium cavendishii DSM 21758]